MRNPLTLMLLGTALLASCGDSPPQSDTRVVVFGVDGLDPELLQQRVDRGMLPNFAKLIENGTFHSLQTSWPPQSPVAWSNFITGTNPGQHGLYDFIHPDHNNYFVKSSMSEIEEPSMELSVFGYNIPVGGGSSLTRKTPAFWEVLADQGVPVYVHRMPANYPMKGTTAVTFPDMGIPDLAGAASGKAFLWSETRAPEDDDSYYIRRASVNRFRLQANDGKGIVKIPLQIYGPEDTVKDLDDLERQMAGLERQRREAEEADQKTEVKVFGEAISKIKKTLHEEREIYLAFNAFLDYTGNQPQVTIEIGDHFGMAEVGQWTDWVPLEFSVMGGMSSLAGYTRFLLKSHDPFELYAAPVQVDPWNQAMPISTPESAATELADAIGPYYTQGFPDAYHAYKSDLLNTAEFISQSDTVVSERRKMMEYALDQMDESGGLLFFYTGSLDLRSHMMWWAQDAQHPHQEPAGQIMGDALYPDYSQQIDRVYVQVDQMLGRLVERIESMEANGHEVELIVMSDHGFAPFRRRMNTNDWLVKEGYLVLKPGKTTGGIAALGKTEDGQVDWDSSIVDWSKTRAYAVGFNGIILNRIGREAQGIVTPAQIDPLLEEMRDKLRSLSDNGVPVLTSIKKATEVFHGDALADAPDLQLGFNLGYGGSDSAAIGSITGRPIIEDNDTRWSGSHLMDPELVRGTIIVRSGAKLSKDPTLEDITATLYSRFGVVSSTPIDGKPLY
jgi:predicted AlkP superfamily phosphohydrolase/phosphomutase